ncbi:MAG: sialate O-acetylesterase [Limisphaerales bacterium]
MYFTLRVACFLAIGSLLATAAESARLSKKEKLRIYLLMGQSNMAGRGELESIDKTPHPRVMMLETNGKWVPAAEPLTKDPHKHHGVGPGLAFGKTMADKNPSVIIGLVPTAVGGTPLSRWQKGGDLYENAVHRAKLAMKDGTLTGIIWHQGESDSGTDEKANSYGARLAQMIKDIRHDLGVNVPFVAGELGQFVINRTNGHPVPLAKVVNAALNGLSTNVPFTGCASSEGLGHKGDDLHFSAPAQREFGRRYAEIMLKLEAGVRWSQVNPPFFDVDASFPKPTPDIPCAAVPGVAIDKAGMIWIYTRTNPTVQVYAPDGRYIRGWSFENTNAIAHAIRFDAEGNVWLVDTGLHTVKKFAPGISASTDKTAVLPEPLLTLGVEGESGEDDRHFNMPTDIAFARNGDVFVTDGYRNNRVMRFDKNGRFKKTWGEYGAAPGQFNIPHAIVCDSKNRVYIADRNNSRIQIFNADGKLLDVWANVIVPWGLCMTSNDELWVAGCSTMPWRFDPAYPNAPLTCPMRDQLVIKFNTAGKPLQLVTFPKAEDAKERPGELNWLHCLAVDADGNLYCGDIIGKRIQKFIRN